jgi:hypothetical protein
MGKRKIAILNIESILNIFFLTEKGAWYNNFKMGLHIELGWEMAVWESKEKNSGWWRHLHLICHFEVLKKKYFYYFFVKERSFQIQNLTKQWKMYAWRSSWFSPPFCFFFLLQFIFFVIFYDLNFQNISLDSL